MNVVPFKGRRRRDRSSIVGRQGLWAVLDIGSSKIVCFVARRGGNGGLEVVGIGHQLSRGIRSGMVVDMDAAEQAIRITVDAAERMAGGEVRDVILSLSCGRPHITRLAVEMPIAGHEVDEQDRDEALREALLRSAHPERLMLHAVPTGFAVDGIGGVRDPRGMIGQTLGVNVSTFGIPTAPVRNLAAAVERCHLGISAAVLSPYAAGLATLVEDERELGAICIDMGGGTTSVSVFRDGHLVFADIVGLGGQHVTSDIARGLSTTLGNAERLKTLHGSALAGPSDERELLDIPLMGEDDGVTHQVPRSMLTGIIRPRLEETFEHIRERLIVAGMDQVGGRRVVLTGGASQLNGARELAARVLGKQVRLGRPLPISGLAEATAGPAFATAAGLLRYPQMHPAELMTGERERRVGSGGPILRFGRWIKENF
jgi:cell division protein FtsA